MLSLGRSQIAVHGRSLVAKSTKKPDNIRTTIDLPSELWRLVKRAADEDDMPVRRVVTLALARYVVDREGARQEGEPYAHWRAFVERNWHAAIATHSTRQPTTKGGKRT